jgi:hypothetical protein
MLSLIPLPPVSDIDLGLVKEWHTDLWVCRLLETLLCHYQALFRSQLLEYLHI